MDGLFKTEEMQKEYIERETEKKKRNRLVRMQRLFRKINLQTWDYFCTFTYDSAKHTEESFKKSLLNCLRHLATNKGWRYIGAWEYSPERERLHFHGIFIIPEMIGELIEVRDWSIKKHRMQTTIQNTHFNNKFGRSDFEQVERREDVISTALYLLKYIEKDNGKLIISRNLPTFFKSDIADEDILCYMDEENRKAILFDNFTCIDEGVLAEYYSAELSQKASRSLQENRNKGLFTGGRIPYGYNIVDRII